MNVLKYNKALSKIQDTAARHTMSLTSKSKLVFCLLVSLFFIPFGTGCVTQTERLGHRPYAPLAKDESIWEEIQGVYGHDSSGEAFYTRTARGIKDTVAAWFDEEDSAGRGSDWDEARQQYEMKRQRAIRRVRQQNTLEGRIEVRQAETHRREP